MSQSSSPTHIGVCWDLENTSAPRGLSTAAAAANITQALQYHMGNPRIKFYAYGDTDQFSSELKESCEVAGIKFIDVPSSTSEAADKSIILDMFQFALDDPPPSYILLISKDQDFARALSTLRHLTYTMFVALEDNVSPTLVTTFKQSCDFVCSWNSLANGDGFKHHSSLQPISISLKLPGVKKQPPSQKRTSCVTGIFWDLKTCPYPKEMLPDKVADYIRNSLLIHPLINAENIKPFNAYKDYRNIPLEVRQIWEKSGISFINSPMGVKKDYLDKKILVEVLQFAFENPVPCNIMAITGDASLSPALCALRNRGFTVILATPSWKDIPTLNTAGTFLFGWPDSEVVIDYDSMWVKPGDVRVLKRNILSLLTSHGGHIKLDSVANEYRKSFGRQLVAREFNNCKNIEMLLGDMVGEVEIKRVGENRTVHSKIQLTSVDVVKRDELQEFLEGFCIGIPLSTFERVYMHQKYQTSLEQYYKFFGVKNLEDLFQKMPDVAMLIEDRKTNTKRVMYALVVKDRRKHLKRDVIALLKEYTGKMVFNYFEQCYKDEFKGAVMYDYYGLTDLEDLCEVFKDILEVRVTKARVIHLL